MDGTLQPDDVLSDRYRIERELGRGAMGVVYAAEDLRHRREVAVKVLSPMAGVAPAAGRFRDEIHTAAQLNHPSILAVHDSGEVGGLPYYVTPRIDGETLRERLRREGRLPVEEAVRIVRLLADALGYAHARGVVHRDVKPENILLDRDGRPYLADFGVALSVRVEDDARRTSAGVAVGSPAYMSPEQATGERDVDGRSDLYALGSVLFEMVAGEHPYAGLTRQATLAHQLTEDPPSLRRRRADVPPWLDEAVRKAMAGDASDRFPTGRAMAGALDGRGRPPARRALGRLRWGRGASGAAALVAGALFAVWSAGEAEHLRLAVLGDPDLDTLRYAVLPFRGEEGARADLVLHEALGRWHELETVDRLQLDDAVAREAGSEDLGTEEARRVARALGAGRYVHGVVSPIGDSVDVEAVLYDTARRTVIRTASVRVVPGTEASDARIAGLGDSLLLGRLGAAEVGPRGTASLAARRAYGGAHEALDRWDLSAGGALLAEATRHDPGFVLAQLWLAQVRDWQAQPPDRWGRHAEAAAAALDELPPRERLLAKGLVHMARGAYPQACVAYDSLRGRDERDFAALYGLGRCQGEDPALVKDEGAPHGWGFRGSYHRAVESYRKAFVELPASHQGFRGNGFEAVREILYTRADRMRFGRAPDGRTFGGWPLWQEDSLALVVHPLGQGGPPSEAHGVALVRQRAVFYDIARAWASAYPRSPDALHALAIALEMLGEPAALDTLEHARTLVPEGTRHLGLELSEVWLRVKLGVPDRPAELERARALADSILIGVTPAGPEEARELSSLAALLGRPAESARLARLAAGDARVVTAPVPVTRAASALAAFAAVGLPRDSILALQAETEALIDHGVPPEAASGVRAALMENASIVAFPDVVLDPLKEDEPRRAPVAEAQRRWLRGDTAGARSALRRGRVEMRFFRPGDRSLDLVYAEARLFALMGDTTAALETLHPPLAALRWVQPGVLTEQGRSGTLVRALVLRARLAAATGDAEGARAWMRAASELWGRGEPHVLRFIEQAQIQVKGRTGRTMG